MRWKKQGDWKFSADYSEVRALRPDIVNTGLPAPGSTTPQVVALPGGPGTGSDYDLKLKRTSLGFGFAKVLARQWQFDASVQTEQQGRLAPVRHRLQLPVGRSRRAAAPPPAPKSAGRC